MSQHQDSRTARTHRLDARRRAQEGQVLILVAAVLALLILPLGLVAWGVIQERADHATIAALFHAAAEDGATGLAAVSVSPLATSTASCASPPTAETGTVRACQSLATALHQHYDQANSRIQIVEALAATQVQVLAGMPSVPARDSETGRTYHYPTVCLQAAIKIGIFAHDGLGIVQHFHACAQEAYRR